MVLTSNVESLCPFFPKGGWKVSLFTAVQAQSIKSDMPKTREEKRAVNTLGLEWDTGCHSNSTVPWKKMRVWSNLRPPRKPTGEGNGNPLQYFCLENPMDRGSWQVARVGHDLATTPPPPRKSTHKFFTLKGHITTPKIPEKIFEKDSKN